MKSTRSDWAESPCFRWHAIVWFVFFLLAGCSKDSSKASAPAEPIAPASAVPSASAPEPAPLASSVASGQGLEGPSPTSSINLLDPGREPRRALRYAFRQGQTERMAIELATTVSAEGSVPRRDVALAPLEIAIALEPKKVSPDGDLNLTWRVESATMAAVDAAADPAVAQGWSAQLLPVQHLSGTATISSRGVCKGITVDPGSAGDAGAGAEMVVQVIQMLRDVAAPLPEEPIGAGARWQKLSTLDASSGHATQTDTYTLTELHSDTGSLADVLAQTATPQALRTGGGPGVAPPHMDQLLTSGTAKLLFDLKRLVPQTTLEGTTAVALSAPSNRVNMVMHLGISVRGTLQ